MNKTPALSPSRSDLASRFAAYRRNMRLGAVAMLSLSTLRALSAVEERQADRLTRSIVAQGRTDDAITDADTETAIADREEAAARVARSYVLAPSEAAAIQAARPGSRSVVWKVAKPAAAQDDDGDQALPVGYVSAPVSPRESLFLPMTAELAAIEAEAREEAAQEVAAIACRDAREAAAVAFRSDWDAPVIADYAPAAAVYSREASRPAVKAALRDAALNAPRDPISDHAALLAAVLGNRSVRRSTVRV